MALCVLRVSLVGLSGWSVLQSQTELRLEAGSAAMYRREPGLFLRHWACPGVRHALRVAAGSSARQRSRARRPAAPSSTPSSSEAWGPGAARRGWFLSLVPGPVGGVCLLPLKSVDALALPASAVRPLLWECPRRHAHVAILTSLSAEEVATCAPCHGPGHQGSGKAAGWGQACDARMASCLPVDAVMKWPVA